MSKNELNVYVERKFQPLYEQKKFTKCCNMIRILNMNPITLEMKNTGVLSTQAEMVCPGFLPYVPMTYA